MGKLTDEIKAVGSKIEAEVKADVPKAESWIKLHAGWVLVITGALAILVACNVVFG